VNAVTVALWAVTLIARPGSVTDVQGHPPGPGSRRAVAPASYQWNRVLLGE
jgi:hypothetical protein